ncbi:transposase domain containing protein [Nephila pilipes]|uniref:Transposase domain containing protein n=1 Tax=Nephila pilipes TaxID=299642 RepID=A0A8X6PWP8_NEPPI|nr:transposase domain containing protein [Nephila pilipes]
MRRQLRVQRPAIRNISDLHDRCLNIWYNLSPVMYQGLVASMPRRVEAVLRAKVAPLVLRGRENHQKDEVWMSEIRDELPTV